MDRITRIFSTDRTPGAPPPVNGSGPAPRKYANINGVMQLNPEYKRWMESQGKAATTAKRPDEALPVVSNMVEYFDMQEANMAAGKGDLPMAPEMIQAMNEMQDPKNCEKIGISPDAIVDALGDVLAKHEAPFGLISKLKLLSQYSALEFIVDDSGSMSLDSDTKNARGHTQSRWEEVRMRLKEMMEILAYIPAPPMRVRFLNRKNDVRIEHKGEAPEVFIERAHREIDKAFSSPPRGGTPIYNVLMRSFEEGRGKKISRYLFCDGCPNGQKAEIREIEKLCTSPTLRGDPQSNPITFLSCTGDDKEVEWMKELEERALFAAEYDDFDDEADEVHRDQGYALPFTKGFHLIGQLVGAMCPDDLDAMDESAPFTKSTLDSLLGVQMNEEDYRRYWEGFMRAQRSRTIESDLDRIKRDQNWEQHYHAFLTTPLARQIPAVIDFKRKLGVDVSAC
ncbi:MAG: hypothetical protein KDK78_01910 [Chlamydiia bacterium]|nr:hypothetical protein [Chlamydiia bacterium]